MIEQDILGESHVISMIVEQGGKPKYLMSLDTMTFTDNLHSAQQFECKKVVNEAFSKVLEHYENSDIGMRPASGSEVFSEDAAVVSRRVEFQIRKVTITLLSTVVMMKK